MSIPSNIVKLKRKPRPLRKTYSTTHPYSVLRHDEEGGGIVYEIFDDRPDSFRKVCDVCDESGENPYAKFDAEQIARGLNFLVQCGKEQLPRVQDTSNQD